MALSRFLRTAFRQQRTIAPILRHTLAPMPTLTDTRYITTSALLAPLSSRSSWLRPGVAKILVRSIFVKTESTPNPNSLKFIPGVDVLPAEYGSSMDFRQFRDAGTSPLAQKLFMLPGVTSVFLGSDFVAVTKAEDDEWTTLKMDIFSTIMDFFAEGEPVIKLGDDDSIPTDTLEIQDDDGEVVGLIKELLTTRIRPTIQDDGGDIHLEGFDVATGLVSLRLAGACVGCASSSVTLKRGVEAMLMHYIPEVSGVVQVYEEEEEEGLM